MNGLPDPDLICANLAKPGTSFCESCIKIDGPAWQRGKGYFDLKGECERCRYFCLKNRYEAVRYKSEERPFTTTDQLCGACTIKDESKGGSGAPDYYWDHLTTHVRDGVDLLDETKRDSGALFLWSDGFHRCVDVDGMSGAPGCSILAGVAGGCQPTQLD